MQAFAVDYDPKSPKTVVTAERADSTSNNFIVKLLV